MTDLAAEFNRRLGQFTGRNIAPTPPELLLVNAAAQAKNRKFADLLVAHALAAKELQKRKEEESKGKTRYKPTGGDISGLFAPELDKKLTQESVDTLIKAEGGQPSGTTRVQPESEDIGGGAWGIGHAPGPGMIWGGIKTALAKPTMTALDYLSRPSRAEFEAMREVLESRNKGESTVDTLQSIPQGFWAGLSGKEHTGFGDVIEESLKRNPNELDLKNPFDWYQAALNQVMYGSGPPELMSDEYQATQPQNKTNPQLWAKRFGGGVGDWYLDPLNRVGVKLVPKILSHGGALGKAAEEAAPYTDDAARALIDEASTKAVKAEGLDPILSKKSSLNQSGRSVPGPTGYERLAEETTKIVDEAMAEVGGGAARGRVIGFDAAVPTIATKLANTIRAIAFGDFDTLTEIFVNQVKNNGTFSSAALQRMRRMNPKFGEFLDELLVRANSKRTVNTFQDIEDVLNQFAADPSKSTILSHIDDASAHVKSTLDDTVRRMQESILDDISKKVYNAPGIRVGGKVLAFDRIGRAYAGSRFRNSGLLDNVRFNRQFPGRIPLINQFVRSLGMQRYEALHREVQDVARTLTKEQKTSIYHALINNSPPMANQELEAARQFIRQKYDEIWDEEVRLGIRKATDVKPDNYVYHYYKGFVESGAKQRDIGRMRTGVKKAIERNGRLDVDTMEQAKKLGLKPEEDPFRQLLHRKLKSNRKVTRVWFTNQLLDTYGVHGNRVSEELARLGKWKKVAEDALPLDVKNALKEGDAWYLPEDVYDVRERFMELSRGVYTGKTSELMKMVDYATRLFKQAATIYYPGFHIRNALGDMFMSFIDGVRVGDYRDAAKILREAHAGKTGSINISGYDFTYEELRQLFRDHVATAGYQRVDLASPELLSKYGANRVNEFIRRNSQRREDFFRFSHFLHAFKEELPTALKSARNEEAALRKAVDVSAYRVNKYLFDYGATTQTERQIWKRIIPFYTYSRKVMPTLFESMALHPSQFSKANRLFLSGPQDNSYNDMLVPQYQKDIGYANLGNENAENPWILGGQFLPTDILQRNTQFGSWSAFMRNLETQSNPLIKMIPELAHKQKSFNQAPISDSRGYFSDAFAPPISPLNQVPGLNKALGGLPVVGQGEWGSSTPYLGGIFKPSRDSAAENLLSGRFGLGLPFDQISDSQQLSSAYGLNDKVVAKLDEYNAVMQEKKGYRVYFSPNKMQPGFRIRNQITGEVVYESTDINEAIKVAKQIIDKAPDVQEQS